MKKLFCDRCGAEIIKTKRTLFDAVTNAMATLKANFGGKYRIKYIVQVIDLDDPKIPRPIADLCEQCDQELNAFMNKFKDKPKTNDIIVKDQEEKQKPPGGQ